MLKLSSVAATCLALQALMAPQASADDAVGSGGFVVVVDYTVDTAHFDKLKALVDGIARATIREPGCRRFDVVAPTTAADHLTLYEVFDDKAAFVAHTATAPFKQFVVDSGAINATRTASPGVMVLSLHNP